MAVGDNGLIRISTDGASWTEQVSGTLASLASVAYGNGVFVAVVLVPPTEPSSEILASQDGTNWIHTSAFLTSINGGFSAVAYGNGQFVATAGAGAVATSVDGMDWMRHEPRSGFPFRSVAYGDGKFVAVRIGASCCPTLFTFVSTSADGITWTQNPQAFSFYNSRIAYGNGQFVVVGSGPTLLSSPDGVNWFYRQSGTTNQLSGIVYGNGRFMTVGDEGTILESDSIITLALTPKAESDMFTLWLTGPTGLAYTIQSSSDLISWQNVTNVTSTQPTTFISDVLPGNVTHLFYRAYSQ